MPIRIQNDLPARAILEDENIFVMDENRALSQDIRPLEVLILNLMPIKQDTELQLLRALSNTPLQINITFLQLESHVSKNTSASHLNQFYQTFSDISNRNFDGLIITGAPVEQMEFEEVTYWDELIKIMDWSDGHVTSTLHICWGAQAGLYHFYGVPKYPLQKKMFGIFQQKPLDPSQPIFRGFDDIFNMPHSRHTEVRREDIEKVPGLDILAESPESGVSIVMARGGREFFVTGHLEYAPNTLDKEYKRDMGKRDDVDLPKNYYYHDDPNEEPLVTWRAHANLFYSNWINYYVYQETPYNIEDIK